MDIQVIENQGHETSVLSSMIQSPERIDQFISMGGNLETFNKVSNRIVFETITSVPREEVEIISLTQHLQDNKNIEKIGGAGELARIFTYSPTSANFERYTRQLIQTEHQRKLHKIIIRYAGKDAREDGISERLISEIESISIKGENLDNEALGKGAMKTLQEALQGEDKGIPYGFERMQSMTGKLRGNQFIIIAARPAMGKTALMMNLIDKICIEGGTPTMIFSIEMTAQQLAERHIYGKSGISLLEIRKTRTIPKLAIPRIRKNTSEFSKSELIIDDSSKDIETIKAEMRRNARLGVRVFGIDYLQLVVSKGGSYSREREVAEISSSLKGLAKELDVSVIALCQINRESGNRSGHKPRMSDLRESGSLEQDADIVILLHRAKYFAENQEDIDEAGDKSEIIIAKCRNGETGIVKAKFNESTTTFSECDD